MEVVFATVIYKGCEQFFSDFIESINHQTYKEFDVLIINDNLDDKIVTQLTTQLEINTKIINAQHLTISQIRKKIIEYTVDCYELLIFGDIDDGFAENRIERILSSYDKDIAFYYNDLMVYGTDNNFFNNKLTKYITSFQDILNYNFLGLTNTAINIKKCYNILKKLPDNKDIIAFDWYLYTYLLLNNACGKYVENAPTYYRIYDNNIAGSVNYLDETKLKNGVAVKISHYFSFKEISTTYKKKYQEAIWLGEKIKDKEFRNKYMYYINNECPKCNFWWENIKINKMEALR